LSQERFLVEVCAPTAYASTIVAKRPTQVDQSKALKIHIRPHPHLRRLPPPAAPRVRNGWIGYLRALAAAIVVARVTHDEVRRGRAPGDLRGGGRLGHDRSRSVQNFFTLSPVPVA
jgi:hypothetical protein